MRRFAIATSIALAAVLAVLVLCEGLLRLLPVSTTTDTGYRLDPAILTYPPHHDWTAATGWDLRNAHRMTASDLGFSALHDAKVGPDAVPLIGDSFVEGSMLDAPDRPAVLLEGLLGRSVTEMSGPGSSLLDYAERIRWAVDHLGARDVVVVMERFDVRQSVCGSGNVHAACLDPVTLEPRLRPMAATGRLKRMLRRSALAQYVVSQLKLDPASLVERAVAQAAPAANPGEAGMPPAAPAASASSLAARDALLVDRVGGRFFARIADHRPARLVIVLDGDRKRLERHAPIDDPARGRFIALVRAHGAVLVDMEPVYAAHFARSTRSLVVGPYDAHPNGLANGMAMKAVAEALAPQEASEVDGRWPISTGVQRAMTR